MARRLPTIIFTIITPIILLGLIEVVLRLFGVQPMPPRRESFIHYQWIKSPLTASFEYYGDSYKELDQRLKIPPESGKRIFVFGGSAAQGWENPETAFPQTLGRIYQEHNRNEIEVFNFAAIGWSSLQVLTAIQQTLHDYHPSLIFIYSGNNELHEIEAMKLVLEPSAYQRRLQMVQVRTYLERMRIVLGAQALLKQIRGPVVRQPMDPDDEIRLDKWPAHEQKERQLALFLFLEHLTRIAQLCQAYDVNLVLSTVAINLRAEYFRDDLSEQETKLLTEARQQLKEWQHHEALATLLELEADRDLSQSHAMRALIHEREKRFDQAKEEFYRASDLAVPPIRALTQVNSIVEGISRKYELPVVDIKSLVEEASPNGLCCYGEPIHDHVHFTKQGNRLVAEAIYGFLTERNLP